MEHEAGLGATAGQPPSGRVRKQDTPLLGSPHRFRLGVFASNTAGGTNLTTGTGAPTATWEETVRIARAAEAAGVEALIPVARWRAMNPRAAPDAHRSFETSPGRRAWRR